MKLHHTDHIVWIRNNNLPYDAHRRSVDWRENFLDYTTRHRTAQSKRRAARLLKVAVSVARGESIKATARRMNVSYERGRQLRIAARWAALAAVRAATRAQEWMAMNVQHELSARERRQESLRSVAARLVSIGIQNGRQL